MVCRKGKMVKGETSKDRAVIEKVYQKGQGHVFRWWEELSEGSRKALLDQLRAIDFALLGKLRKKCTAVEEVGAQEVLEPVEVVPIPRTVENRKKAEEARGIGEDRIRAGKLAVFVVAGGQGTRLGFEGPKGLFPVGPVTGKSLFQMHAEKMLAESWAYGVSIPWYIMTSEANDGETRDFFKKNDFFGLSREDIFFLKQRMLPALDGKGDLILDAKDHIFTSPNGHGGSLLALEESGALDDMKRRGVECISYFQVDNVLIKVVDPVFIGYHVQARAEMSSKMVMKRHPLEKVGVFGRVDGRLRVVEYSDLREAEMTARNPDGSLKYGAGSIAIHLIEVSFVEDEVRGGLKLPYHAAHKKIPYLDEEGRLIRPEEPNGYKFETFVFDALGDTSQSIVMEVEREEEFSPVKNREGEDSPETARRDLANYFSGWLESAGISVPRNERGGAVGQIEISPLFARTREAFRAKVPRDLRFTGSLYLGPE
jgi:UDP-N-acetylglucosamine/UDP-N-acetylgalactosamine diphosphorylase